MKTCLKKLNLFWLLEEEDNDVEIDVFVVRKTLSIESVTSVVFSENRSFYYEVDDWCNKERTLDQKFQSVFMIKAFSFMCIIEKRK